MAIKINADFLGQYVFDKVRHKAYEKTVELEEKLRVHADGEFPKKLIGERRPSESKKLFEYRKEIFESQTEQPFSKISTSLGKIRKSQDWSIQHPKEITKRVPEEESLQSYTELNFPNYTSITNWFFSLGLREYTIDSNAIIAVSPSYFPVDNSYLTPVPIIYNSSQVLDYAYNQYAVLLSKEKNVFVENKKTYEGNIIYIYTTEEFWVAKEYNAKGEYKLELINKHDLGFLPCRKMRGVFSEQIGDHLVYKSRIYPCVASWNEAAREYSDMQASVCKHMFPTMVIHTNAKCKTCNGTGKVLVREGKEAVTQVCGVCKGDGGIPTSPYEDIVIRPTMASEQPLPTPVAYYIDKDTGIIKIQDERIDKHLYRALSAINFEFLAANLNQSGVAKELDRSELNAFVYDIAEDIISILDDIYYFTNEWRYKFILSPEEREKQLPKISVPEKFDIISETYLADQIEKAKKSKSNPFIINALEIEYANKKFNTDAGIRDLVKTSLELDPLPSLSEDEKLVRLMNKGILQEDYIISCYIVPFVRRAVEEDNDFLNKPYAEKLEVLRKYAQEIAKKSSAAEKVKEKLEPSVDAE